MQREKDRISKTEYKGYELVATTSENQSFNKRNLDQTIKVIESAFDSYNKIIQFHFILRLPAANTPSDPEFQEVKRRFNEKLRTLFRGKTKGGYSRGRLSYIQAVEIEKAKSRHIHLMLFVNAARNQPEGLVRMVESAWCHAVGDEYIRGLVEYRKQDGTNGYNFSIQTSAGEAVKWASYLCKSRGKQESTQCFSSSRIPTK